MTKKRSRVSFKEYVKTRDFRVNQLARGHIIKKEKDNMNEHHIS